MLKKWWSDIQNLSFISKQHIKPQQLWGKMILWLHEWNSHLLTSHTQHPAAISLTQLSHSASTDVPLPHLVIMNQMSGVGVNANYADSSSQWRFLFHSLHYRSPSAKPLLTFISSALSNKSPCSPHPRPQSHADWPDVPSLIMNISIIIRRTTIAG